LAGSINHSVVVGDDVSQVLTQLLRGRQMDGIQGSDVGGLKRARGIEDTVIYPDHVESAEHCSAASESDFALES
jgi:hypothetical protein